MTGRKNINKGRALLLLAFICIAVITILLLTNTGEIPVVQGIIETVTQTVNPNETQSIFSNTPNPADPAELDRVSKIQSLQMPTNHLLSFHHGREKLPVVYLLTLLSLIFKSDRQPME